MRLSSGAPGVKVEFSLDIEDGDQKIEISTGSKQGKNRGHLKKYFIGEKLDICCFLKKNEETVFFFANKCLYLFHSLLSAYPLFHQGKKKQTFMHLVKGKPCICC